MTSDSVCLCLHGIRALFIQELCLFDLERPPLISTIPSCKFTYLISEWGLLNELQLCMCLVTGFSSGKGQLLHSLLLME